MIRSLAEAESYLQSLVNRERIAGFDYEKHGLDRIRALLEEIGSPQRGLPCIHVTGSKGKGTFALAAGHLLQAAGVRAGVYTSPHLASWLERFRVGDGPAPASRLVAELERMRPAVERLRRHPELCPSFFDVTTALAFALFRAEQVRCAVLEVGIGGRLDSTTVCEPTVCAITAVQLEHVGVLGDTLEAIAREKAGILKPGVPLVHGPLAAEALAAVLARAASLDVPADEVRAERVSLSADGIGFELPDGRALRAPILGAHQATNLSLAVAAVERFLGRALAPAELASLDTLELPARIERFGPLILDDAHTPDSARALRETLGSVFPGRRWVLGISIARDKDAAGILAELAPATRACVISGAEPLRSLPPDELRPLARAAGIPSPELEPHPHAALARVRALRRPEEIGVLTGSVFFAGAVRGALCEDLGPGGRRWR
jgi:dihydrofolate synthase/folylpolyglutamate synthase